MPLRTLVVEDDPLQQAVLVGFLSREGHYVVSVGNGLDALREGRLGWFDVVIMDYNLPEIDGAASARLIGMLAPDERRPTIIALTARAEALCAAVGPDRVFDAILQKPWEPQVLLDTLHRCRERLYAVPTIEPTGNDDRHLPDVTAGPDAAQPRVLVIEDDALLASILTDALRLKQYHVDTATNGFDALRIVSRARYDVALLDYNLPEMDGLAVARLIYELLQAAHRPRLIALTSSPQSVISREAGTLSAFDDVVAKSSGMEQVISSIERSVNYRQLRPHPSGVNVFKLPVARPGPAPAPQYRY